MHFEKATERNSKDKTHNKTLSLARCRNPRNQASSRSQSEQEIFNASGKSAPSTCELSFG